MSLRLPHWIALALLVWVAPLANAEPLPPAPSAYFNDYAGVVSASTARTLNNRLQQFERDTSNQLVVAIFPRMESSSSIEDYTVRVAQSWGVGQKGKNNGAVLFVFVASHQLYIQVGYGLEGALPDATCKAIIDHEIKPRFRAGDYGGGLDAAVTAMIAATKGEYQGTGRTQGEQNNNGPSHVSVGLIVFLIAFLFFIKYLSKQDRTYGRSSRNNGWWTGSGGDFGGGSSGGGSGFSGGGGSFGGGGSGGSW